MGLEIEVLREDACTDEFLLEDGDKVEEVFGLATTDVIDGIGWDGESIVALFALGGALHHADDSLDNVIDIGEVAAAVAVVVDLDGFALQEFVGETEIGHVWTACRTIDGEEAQASRGNIVELGIAVGHELVGLLCRSVKRYRVIHSVICAEWYFFVTTVYT